MDQSLSHLQLLALTILITFATTFLKGLLGSHLFMKSKKQEVPLPPGPKPWPLIGNFPQLLANRPTFRWINKLMKEMNTEIACIRLGNVHVIPVTCPTIAREFLRKQDATFASRPKTITTSLVTRGYLTTTLVPSGEQWKKMKRIYSNELLSSTMHQQLQHKTLQEANKLVFYIYNKCKNNVNDNVALLNMRHVTQHYCCNVIKKLSFSRTHFGEGGKDGGPGLEEEEHIDAVFTLLKYIYDFSITDYVPGLRLLDFVHERNVKKAMQKVNKYHDPIIEQRIKEWSDGSKIDKEDFLDILISLKDSNNNPLMTAEEIKAQCTEFMMAASDNPSNAFEWALAEMLNQPELLQRATEELDRVVGKERLVEESDIPKLNYVRACARESYRLHPIAAYNIPHLALKDAIVGKYLIPKGSHVMLSRMELGRNSKVWGDDALKFKPERHLNKGDVVLTEPDLNFMSFSTGRRSCPGIMLGTTITMILFARLLHSFTWTAPPNASGLVDLSENHDDILLAQPLLALAKPRLPPQLYTG